MGKKYTLKAVRPDTPPQEAVEIQPVVDAPQSKTETSSSDFLGFLKFLLIVACVGGLVLAVNHCINKARNEAILEELSAQLHEIDIFEDLEYYDEFKDYLITFKLDSSLSSCSNLYRASQANALKWADFVMSMCDWNDAAIECIRKHGSKANCCISLLDSNNSEITYLRNGVVIADKVSGYDIYKNN